MRVITAFVIALVLVAWTPAAAQTDLSALGAKARMPVTLTMQDGTLADVLSLLAAAGDIEFRLEAALPTRPAQAAFNNADLHDVLSFLLRQAKLKATAIDRRVVVISSMGEQEPQAPAGAGREAAAAVRLRMEIYKNSQPAARPMLVLASGTTGSIDIRNVAKILATPTAVDESQSTIAFEITIGGTTVKPQLVLRADEPGSISLTSESGSDNFELRVTRVR